MSEDTNTKPVRISEKHHEALIDWCDLKGYKLGKAIERLLESDKDFMKILEQVKTKKPSGGRAL